jgi:hypothetical protein
MLLPASDVAGVACEPQPVSFRAQAKLQVPDHAANALTFRRDKQSQNEDNMWSESAGIESLGTSAVFGSRSSILLLALFTVGALLWSHEARAQWWSRAPADFEDCADRAEKATTREERSSQLSQCNAKFAARRKPGGGYTYFDFMQNRSFDIAGPNPTPAEQKEIDEQYTAFLDRERQSRIAAELTAKQQLMQQVSLRNEKVPLPTQAPNKPQPALGEIRLPRPKPVSCVASSFSCEWPRLSEGIKDLKKLFSSSPAKPKREPKQG